MFFVWPSTAESTARDFFFVWSYVAICTLLVATHHSAWKRKWATLTFTSSRNSYQIFFPYTKLYRGYMLRGKYWNGKIPHYCKRGRVANTFCTKISMHPPVDEMSHIIKGISDILQRLTTHGEVVTIYASDPSLAHTAVVNNRPPPPTKQESS
jgi:hypothetical protein